MDKNLLNDIDYLLCRFEDWMHGKDGNDVTLMRKRISDAIKEHPKSNDELLKKVPVFVEGWMLGDPESFQKAEGERYFMYSNILGTDLNLQVYFEECIEDFLAEYSSLVNQEDAVKFAEWVAFYCTWNDDYGIYSCQFKVGAFDINELYQLYQEYLKQNL